MKLFVVATIIGVCAAGRLDNQYLPPRGNAGAGTGFGGGYNAPAAGGFKSAGGFGSQGSAGFGQTAGAFGQSAGGFGQSAGGFGKGAGFGGGTQHSGNLYNAAPQQYSGAGFSGRSNSADANAQILRSNSEVTADGFSYDFETSNGIRADAQGVATNGVHSAGSFAYKGDDGQDYSITYTADENGYRPQGAHLPTPPPIPEEILKSLEQNARDEAAGISDDGQYRGEGAGAGGYSGGQGYSAPAPSNQYGAPGAHSGNFGGQSGNFGGQSGSFGGQSGSFGGQSGNFGGHSGSQSSFGARGAAASRQYLAPNAGPNRPSGNGNFNSQSGYQY